MKQLDEAKDLVKQLETLPNDFTLIQGITNRLIEIVEDAFNRAQYADTALQVVVVDDNMPGEKPDWLDPETLCRLGFIYRDDDPSGDPFYVATVKGEQFIRRALTDLHVANQEQVPA